MGTSAPPTTLDISLYFWVFAWASLGWLGSGSAQTAPGGLSTAAPGPAALGAGLAICVWVYNDI